MISKVLLSVKNISELKLTKVNLTNKSTKKIYEKKTANWRLKWKNDEDVKDQ